MLQSQDVWQRMNWIKVLAEKEKSIAAPSVVQVGVWCSSNHQCRQIGLVGWLFDGDDCCCCKLLIIMTLSFAGRWQKK